MNFNFGEVLTRAWQIIWKHKILWVFGIFAGCGRSGGSFNSNFSSRGSNGGDGQPPEIPPQMMRWLQTIEQNLTTIIIVMVAVVCIIWIVTTFLSAIGKIGLIRGTAQAEGGAASLVFGELFSGSVPYFWRMFGLSLILGLPVFIIVMAIAVVLVGGIAASGGNETAIVGIVGMTPIMIGCLCLLMPVMFVLGMIFRQAENAVVLEEMDVLPAITRGWEVFKANLGPIILMAIILAVIGFAAGFVIVLPIFAIVFPAMIAFMAGQGQNLTPLYMMGACLCLFIPVAWLLQGIIIAYAESAWTLTYMRLTKPQDNAPLPTEANA
ncbi:MAG: hypothetical protein IPM31_04675 [Anaerolineae bacterium]|jgi:hypothetical protein|nr:hypothetical protein [Anaerolineae bacterium]MBL8103938.1 hypothetical protein [Anaerolineales bacterium]MCC7188825.1 hypothetical protein [Anaerolineales bacterium]